MSACARYVVSPEQVRFNARNRRGIGPAGFLRSAIQRLGLAAGLFEVVDNGRVGEGGGISEVVLAFCDAPEDAAHDLAAPRLGQVGAEDDLLRPGVGAYGLPDLVVEFLDEIVGAFAVAFENDVGHDGLTLVLVVAPDDGGLGHALVGDERALDLHRADAVPGDVHHVVYPARDGVVAVLVALGPVLDEVLVAEPLPVGFAEALGILVDGAQHAGPRFGDDQVALARALYGIVFLVVDVDGDAGEGPRGAAWLGRGQAGEGRDHDRAGLRLPPRVHDRAPAPADVLVVPLPRPRVDGL